MQLIRKITRPTGPTGKKAKYQRELSLQRVRPCLDAKSVEDVNRGYPNRYS
jgi:hypothetical protein